MDFDFALILVLATLASGIIWIADKYYFEPRRKQALAQAREQAEIDPALEQKLLKAPEWIDTGRSMFPVLAIVFVLRSFIIEPFQIPSGSMLPTLKIGDFILVNKYHYGIRLPVINKKVFDMSEPERGDVVVFRYPKQPNVNYIKRLVGLPGDKIRYANKTLTINGEVLPMELLAKLPPSRPEKLLMSVNTGEVNHQIYQDTRRAGVAGEWVVPEGHYFMMGDNRDNSNDSRYWGFVSDDLLVGRAFAVWMHWPELLSIPDFSDVRKIH